MDIKDNVNSKLDSFAKTIMEDTEKISDQELLEFSYNYATMLKEEKDKMSKKSEEIIKEAKTKAKMKKQEKVSKTKNKEQYSILKLEKTLLLETIEDLKKLILNYTTTSEYEIFMLSNIKKAILRFDEDEIVLYAKKDDLKMLEKKPFKSLLKKIEIKECSDTILGGFICRNKQNTIEIDSTLLLAIEDNKELIGKRLINNLR